MVGVLPAGSSVVVRATVVSGRVWLGYARLPGLLAGRSRGVGPVLAVFALLVALLSFLIAVVQLVLLLLRIGA